MSNLDLAKQQTLFNHLNQSKATHAYFFCDQGIITDLATQNAFLPLQKTLSSLTLEPQNAHTDNNILSLYVRSPLSPPEIQAFGHEIAPIKAFVSACEPISQGQILRAYHWFNWDQASQYCGQCGTDLPKLFHGTEKICRDCHLSLFPKFSPAVMVLIYRENKVLLGRSAYFTPGVYSALAGFIDLGETAEQAAHREVKEEVGITLDKLRYFSSQSWPFPDRFMIAFTGEAREENIVIDPTELEDAQWFDINALPPLPHKASIARQMIDKLLNQDNTANTP